MAATRIGTATRARGDSDDARPNVLIVDDEPGTIEVLRDILEEDGYQTCAARNGHEALRVYSSTQPDVVLLDLKMPVMDGLTALGEIRRVDPDARVAILSGICTKDAVRSAMEAGARSFILKPVDVDQVRGAVEELLAA